MSQNHNNKTEDIKEKRKRIKEEIELLKKEERLARLRIDEGAIERLTTLLCISGFSVEYFENLKFKLWVRGHPEEYAYIIFEIYPDTLTVDIIDAGGQFSRYRQKKHKALFEQNIIGLYCRATTEE